MSELIVKLVKSHAKGCKGRWILTQSMRWLNLAGDGPGNESWLWWICPRVNCKGRMLVPEDSITAAVAAALKGKGK